jgi:hypothetical protein
MMAVKQKEHFTGALREFLTSILYCERSKSELFYYVFFTTKLTKLTKSTKKL